jgi:hypothetical protein
MEDKKEGWNIKPILFFIILFGIIIYGYFYYETFTKYIPLPNFIKVFILILGLGAIFFPGLITKWKESDTLQDVEKFLIEKYSKKDKNLAMSANIPK